MTGMPGSCFNQAGDCVSHLMSCLAHVLAIEGIRPWKHVEFLYMYKHKMLSIL